MQKKSLRVPWLIVIVALLLVAVVLALGYQSFKAIEKAAFVEFNQRQLVLAREAVGGIELYFEHLAADMQTLARLPEIQHLDKVPTKREMQYMFYELDPWGVNDIAVLDADGIVRYNVKAPELEGVDFSWREYYQEAKEMTPDAPYIVEFIEFKGVEVGQKGVLVAVPMFENTTDENYPDPSCRFAGVVVCTLKLDTITRRFVDPIQSSARGHAFLIDDEYDVLWAPDRSLFGKNLLEEGDGFPAFQQIVERMRAGNSGVGEYVYYKFEDSTGEYAGNTVEEKLIAYTPIRLGNETWAIGVWAPKEDAWQLIRSAYLSQLFVVVLSLLIILLGASYSLMVSNRFNKFLAQEVEAKTGELEESHQRLLTVLDSLDAIVYVADLKTYEILFANKHLRDLLSDAVGRTCWQVLQTGQSGPCDFCPNEELLTADGEPSRVHVWESRLLVTGRWYEIRDRAIRWVDERIARLEIAMDITERKQAAEALEAAHAFQQSIIDGVAEPILVIDADYQVKLMNRAAHKFSHRDLGTSDPLFCYQISHQREIPCKEIAPCKEIGHPCPMQQVRESGQPVTVEHQHYQADGQRRFIEVLASPLWGTDGTFQGIIESNRDITERVRAEEAVRESESKFRQLFQNANDAIYLWELRDDGMPGHCIEVNDVACQMLGYSRDELLTMTPADIDADEYVPQIPKIMEKILAKEHFTFEMCHKSKDGRETPVEISSHVFTMNDEKVILSIARDITERKQAEAALQESEEQYRRLVELSPDAISVQVEDEIVFMNSAGVDLFGAAEAEQLNGKSVWDFVPSEYRQIVEERYRQMRQEGTKVPLIELKLMRLDGTSVDVEVTAIPLTYADKPAIQAIFRDISERKRTEEALQQYAERLRALATRLAEVAEAEQQRLARELHDQVGQNLTALGINLNIVRSQIPKEEAASVRSRLDDSLSLVEQTTERVRDVMADLRPPVLDDYGLVTALHWYGEQFARRTDIAVVVDGEEFIPRLAMHVENALFRIVQEALTNVAKHAQAARVLVAIEVENGTLRLIVVDDGIGFDPTTLAEPDRGRGWGMLTMAERAEAVGGHCHIESAPGQGTQVIVEVTR